VTLKLDPGSVLLIYHPPPLPTKQNKQTQTGKSALAQRTTEGHPAPITSTIFWGPTFGRGLQCDRPTLLLGCRWRCSCAAPRWGPTSPSPSFPAGMCARAVGTSGPTILSTLVTSGLIATRPTWMWFLPSRGASVYITPQNKQNQRRTKGPGGHVFLGAQLRTTFLKGIYDGWQPTRSSQKEGRWGSGWSALGEAPLEVPCPHLVLYRRDQFCEFELQTSLTPI